MFNSKALAVKFCCVLLTHWITSSPTFYPSIAWLSWKWISRPSWPQTQQSLNRIFTSFLFSIVYCLTLPVLGQRFTSLSAFWVLGLMCLPPPPPGLFSFLSAYWFDFFMCMGILPAYMSTPLVCLVSLEVRKMELEPLELQLQVGCELPWVLGIEFQSSKRAVRLHDHWSPLSTSNQDFLIFLYLRFLWELPSENWDSF